MMSQDKFDPNTNEYGATETGTYRVNGVQVEAKKGDLLMSQNKTSLFCDKCGQNKNLAYTARAQESAYQSLLEQAEKMERALEFLSGHRIDTSKLGFVELEVRLFSQSALEQFRAFKRGFSEPG